MEQTFESALNVIYFYNISYINKGKNKMTIPYALSLLRIYRTRKVRFSQIDYLRYLTFQHLHRNLLICLYQIQLTFDTIRELFEHNDLNLISAFQYKEDNLIKLILIIRPFDHVICNQSLCSDAVKCVISLRYF